MKIAIIGAGGTGGYFGAKLAQAGNNVTFLARGEHLEAIKKSGLTVKSIDDNFHVANIKATDKISEIEAADLILVCVKAWQIKEIRNELKSLLHTNTVVLPVQNGVLAAQELSETLGQQYVAGALCRIISKIEAPGVINHIGVKPTIVFGDLYNSLDTKLNNIKNVLENAEIAAKISTNIEAELWKKFIAICVSGLMAVTKTTYGEMCQLPQTRSMMIDLLTEIYNLSQKTGIAIEPEFVEKTIAFMDTFPYNSTSSLTRDVWAGKPSEIEYQNGTVVKLGEKYGINTPINRFIYNSILPMELKARNNGTLGINTIHNI